MKICCSCKLELSNSNFNKCKTNRDGLSKRCRECRKNLEKTDNYKKYQKEYRLSVRDNENYRSIKRAKRDINKEREYWQRNKFKKAQKDRKYVANKINQLGYMPKDAYEYISEYYGPTCLRCQSLSNICFDHVIPLSMGGLHDIYNIQILCRSCNSKKGARNKNDYRNSWMKIEFYFWMKDKLVNV